MKTSCNKKGKGLKFFLDIEGTLYEWDHATITTEQIAELGGWDPSLGVILIDKHNNERTLKPGEVVQLKPGMGFSKKIHFKRGDVLQDRLEAELSLLRERYPRLVHKDGWVKIPDYPLPDGWNIPATDIAFHIRKGFPGIGPYGLYVPAGLLYKGRRPENYKEPAKQQPPFGGTWGILSWEATNWKAAADPRGGHNLLNWLLGASTRFREGC